MTVEELFDNKIMWFDQPLSLDAFERFGELLVLFLESKGIDTEEIKKTIERLSQELYDNDRYGACVYYLRFYKVGNRERSYYSLNGYLGSLRGLENAKLAYDERVNEDGFKPIRREDLFDYSQTEKIFNSLHEQDDFDWVDLNVPLPAGDDFVITFCETPISKQLIDDIQQMLPNYHISGFEDLGEEWVKYTHRHYGGEIVMYFDVIGNQIDFTGWDTCQENSVGSYRNVFSIEEFTRIYGKSMLKESTTIPLRINDIVIVNGFFQGKNFNNKVGTIRYFKGGGKIVGIEFEGWSLGHNGRNFLRSGPFWEFFMDKRSQDAHGYTITPIEKELYDEISNVEFFDSI